MSLSTADRVTFEGMRVGAALALAGQICILLEVKADWKQGGTTKQSTRTTVSRLLFAMQFAIIVWDLVYIAGMAVVPQGTLSDLGYNGAYGNTATCTMGGFFVAFGALSIGLYDMMLSIAYVLMVRFNWPTLQLERFEKIHYLIWPITTAICLIPIFYQTYNFNWGACFVQTIPPNCQDPDCERGSSANKVAMRQVINTLGINIPVAVAIISMALIGHHMWRLERKNQQYYSGRLSITSKGRRSKKIAQRGILYVSVFFFSMVPISIFTTVNDQTGLYNPWVVGICVILTSLHGFFYSCFFCYDRQMKTRYGIWFKTILKYGFCCCCSFCCWKQEQSGSGRRSTATTDASTTIGMSSKSFYSSRSRTSSSFQPPGSNHNIPSTDNNNAPPPPASQYECMDRVMEEIEQRVQEMEREKKQQRSNADFQA